MADVLTSLAALEASDEREARLNEPFVVIGAMLIAPWIPPLHSGSSAILRGRIGLVGRRHQPRRAATTVPEQQTTPRWPQLAGNPRSLNIPSNSTELK